VAAGRRFVSAAEAREIGLVDEVSPMGGGRPSRARHGRAPCGRPRAGAVDTLSGRSTSAWMPTWPPARRSSGGTSRACSRPGTGAPECAVSSGMGRGRPPSPGA